MAPNAKFTEQAQPMAVGEGQLWKLTTEGPTTFKIPVPDPMVGQIGLIVMLKASLAGSASTRRWCRRGARSASADGTGDRAVGAAAQSRQNRQITEAEHVFARIDAPAQIAALQTPRPALLATVPPAERTPRSMMFLIANAYYDSLVLGDGELTPFADDCGRRENGMHTAGVGRPAPVGPARAGGPGGPPGGGPQLPTGCAEQLTARAMTYIGSIDLRRIWIADEERGLVFAYTMFRHPLDRAEQELSRAASGRDDQRSNDELRPVRSRGGAHLQDLRRQDARDRGDGLHAAAKLEERLEPVHQVAHSTRYPGHPSTSRPGYIRTFA